MNQEHGIVPQTRLALTRSLVLLAAAAALALADALAPARAEYANPDGVAVIVGNRSYAGDIPAVDFAHRDADAFRRYVLDVLGFDPENVIDLRDATQAQMWSTFGSRTTADRSELWSYLSGEGSDVVVFYSGHGAPGLEDGRGYLLPVDADPNTAELNGYPIEVLYRNLSSLAEARSVAVYLDACFSGASGGGGMLIDSASPVYVAGALPEQAGERLSVLTAATGEQLASWDREARHGLFTHHLLDALHGGGDRDGDGRVTAREAKAYLDRHLTRAARRTLKRRQNPSFAGNPDAVLASAGSGGAFPPRPVLDGAGAGAPRDGAPASAFTEVVSVESAKAEEEALGLTYEQRLLVQHGLVSLGHDLGVADGLFGRRVRLGILGVQKEKGLPETGYLTDDLRDVLIVLGEAWRRTDDEAYAEAKRLNTSASYGAYLEGGGRHVAEARKLQEERIRAEEAERVRQAEARRRADDEAFAGAKRLNTVASYEAYVERGGRHVAEARRRQSEAAEPGEKTLGLTRAQRQLVQHGLASQGEDVGAADGVFGKRTRTGLRAYQRKNGLAETGYLTAKLRDALVAMGEQRQAEERRRRADDEAFARARKLNTVASFRAYLERGGRHVAEARRLHEEAEREAVRRRLAEEQRRADDEAVSLAKRTNTITGYEEYLSSYPEGRHVDEVLGLLAAAWEVKWPAGKKFRDCAECPQMVVVPSGSYEMGSREIDVAGPVRRVRIAEPFAVGVHEVTRGEWSRFVGATGHSMGNSCKAFNRVSKWRKHSARGWSEPGFNQGNEHPVVCVSWEDAKAYVRWRSRETGAEYRLLSESEWEYVGRAGTTSRYWWGDGLGRNRANCRRCGSRWDERRTAPVGSFSPNAFGLYDVHGNVSEWVEDCWHDSYRGAPSDGRAWTTGGECGLRMLRGGAWNFSPFYLRFGVRGWFEPGSRVSHVGFRVARTLD